MFVTKARGQMKDREVGGQRKSSHAALHARPGELGDGVERLPKDSHVGRPFVFHFAHSPQILPFPSAQTHRVISSPTHWSILPARLPLPWTKPQLHSPKRLSPEILFGFSVPLSQRQEVGVLDLLDSLYPLT